MCTGVLKSNIQYTDFGGAGSQNICLFIWLWYWDWPYTWWGGTTLTRPWILAKGHPTEKCALPRDLPMGSFHRGVWGLLPENRRKRVINCAIWLTFLSFYGYAKPIFLKGWKLPSAKIFLPGAKPFCQVPNLALGTQFRNTALYVDLASTWAKTPSMLVQKYTLVKGQWYTLS